MTLRTKEHKEAYDAQEKAWDKLRLLVKEKRVYDTGEEFLNIKEDRKEIERIIRINLPLMNLNEGMCQNIADAILVYFIEKKEKKI